MTIRPAPSAARRGGFESFDVGDQVIGGVRCKIDCTVAGVGRASPAAPLVEQHDSIFGRVEKLSHSGHAPRPWTTVHRQRRDTLWITRALPIDAVALAHIEQSRLVGFIQRIQRQLPCHDSRPYPPVQILKDLIASGSTAGAVPKLAVSHFFVSHHTRRL